MPKIFTAFLSSHWYEILKQI